MLSLVGILSWIELAIIGMVIASRRRIEERRRLGPLYGFGSISILSSSLLYPFLFAPPNPTEQHWALFPFVTHNMSNELSMFYKIANGVYLYLELCVFVYLLSMVRPRNRGLIVRLFLNIPAAIMIAFLTMCFPITLVARGVFLYPSLVPYLPWAAVFPPIILVIIGVITTLSLSWVSLDIHWNVKDTRNSTSVRRVDAKDDSDWLVVEKKTFSTASRLSKYLRRHVHPRIDQAHSDRHDGLDEDSCRQSADQEGRIDEEPLSTTTKPVSYGSVDESDHSIPHEDGIMAEENQSSDGSPWMKMTKDICLQTVVPAGEHEMTFVQISDSHLGSWMSVAKLKSFCKRIIEWNPDFVFLTGDYFTSESSSDFDGLIESLSPLSRHPRVFACLGNHDHEVPIERLHKCFDALKIKLLIDESTVCALPSNPSCKIRIIGADCSPRKMFGDPEQISKIFDSLEPRDENTALDVFLLHNPTSLQYIPRDAECFVLSGHVHGGQVGLVACGANWTVANAFAGLPDHGFWTFGKNLLYCHRGTGFYGFPLRIGVTSERNISTLRWRR